MPTVTRTALILLIFASLLSLRLLVLWDKERAETLPRHIGQKVKVEGAIADDPDVRDTSVRVNLQVSAIDGAIGSGTLLAVLPKGTDVSYGDTLVVEGPVEAPQSFLTDTGRVFDYPGYLRVRGISALMGKAELVSRKPGGLSLRAALFSLKHAFERSIERIMPKDDAALLEGILLGERRGLPDYLTQAFIIASLIHVVVLSGYNISIVAEATLRSLRKLPRILCYALATLLMLLFITMTGGGSTSLRAGIMALIAILARFLRRPSDAMRALAVAAALLVVWNPLVVLYDPSFILSFLATFGLITLSPSVEALLPRRLGAQWRSIAASTIAVQLYLLPALLYFTGIVSIWALPANLLVLPLIPFAMLAGFIAGLLGLVSGYLALIPALMCETVLHWAEWVATTAANLPYSHATVPAFSARVALCIYVPLSWLAWRMYARNSISAASSRAHRSALR